MCGQQFLISQILLVLLIQFLWLGYVFMKTRHINNFTMVASLYLFSIVIAIKDCCEFSSWLQARRTEAVRYTQFLGFCKRYHLFWSLLVHSTLDQSVNR